MSEVTRILSAIEQGDPLAAEQLLPLVYNELRALAAQKVSREAPGQTLQATALVHEAYLRLVNVEEIRRWDSRGHFFATAAETMRRILVEQARRRDSQKRGGGMHRVDLDAAAVPAPIGPYELREPIGEGGFGVVFRAEQRHPVRREVALKVLKPGMGTREVIARFEAERQALALMDHPNIAKVLDAGATASGRPYFVMELVRGAPVTDFCDQHHLSVRQRLELFVSVCRAVQHAHQKGVIHRDVKPANILVTLHDGGPLAKVIDFGVAKATGRPLTDKTLVTHSAQLVGTPLYMSPEQAQMTGQDVDTRSDIYSLGVLLYELLTGTTPFDKDRLRTAAYDEIRRIIREEEPARPSTRLSTLGPAAVTASANRQSDPKRLNGLLRGELDWVVMKCLEKDRDRRYDTASALARDVERYLRNEPVRACPPSAWYRLRKFARRNKAGLAIGVLTVLFVVLLAVGAGWVMWWVEALPVGRQPPADRRMAGLDPTGVVRGWLGGRLMITCRCQREAQPTDRPIGRPG